MTLSATHSIAIPRRFAADIERQVERELIKMGYGRLGIDEDDLPGLHFPQSMKVGPSYIQIVSESRAVPGPNLFVIPIPYINEEGNWSVNSRQNVLLQMIRVSDVDCRDGRVDIEDPWTHERYTLDVIFDPDGPDLRERWARHLPQAVMAAEIARSRSPLRRFARAIGF